MFRVYPKVPVLGRTSLVTLLSFELLKGGGSMWLKIHLIFPISRLFSSEPETASLEKLAFEQARRSMAVGTQKSVFFSKKVVV